MVVAVVGKMPENCTSNVSGGASSNSGPSQQSSSCNEGAAVNNTTSSSWFSTTMRTWWERVTKFTCDAVILIIKCIGPA